MNILAVDDSKSIRCMLNNVLTSAGHIVTMASDGREGADLAANTRYDLVITDVKMPEMDGFELVTHLRQTAEYKSVPIIFVTSETEEDFKEKGIKSGASAWITKPFSPINLLEVVAAAVSKRMNILIADDSKSIRCMLNNVLSGAGHAVVMACDGKEAADLASNSKFDLVITDVNMPEMNGLELARHLRAAGNEFTPIIFLTTESSEEFMAKGKEVGAAAWITKPFSPINLLEVVDKIQ